MPIATNSREDSKSFQPLDYVERSADTALCREGVSSQDDDCVDVASEDSFPASDAPSWTVVTGTGTPVAKQ